MPRSLIEQWLPVATLGAESMRERGASSALPPVNFFHVWWARRPLTASRAAVLASLLPAWPDEDDLATDPDVAQVLDGLKAEFPGGEKEYHEWYVGALGIKGDPVAARQQIKAAVAKGTKTPGNAYGYPRAFTVSPDAITIERIRRLAALRADVGERVTLLDPFAGGGSIPFEAARYGCDTIANELNPVASAILAGTVELPVELGPEFATIIQRYGQRWSERVRKRLDKFFPLIANDERLAYIWAHTVPCPTTGRPTPLAPDFWLARGKAGRDVAVKLDVDRGAGTYSLDVVEGAGAARWGNVSTYKKGTGTSIWTGETFSGNYIQKMAAEGQIDQMLLAVSVTRPKVSGRQFRAPTEEDFTAVTAASQELAKNLPAWEIDDLIPSEEIGSYSNYDRGHRMYGINRWREFFSDRQLLSNMTMLEELHRVTADAQEKLGQKEGRAIGLYLGIALDKSVDYNSRQCSWDATRLKVRNTFDKHNFAFKWTFAEFDGAHALLPWAMDQVVDSYAGMSNLACRTENMLSNEQCTHVDIMRNSATELTLEKNSVDAIVTDPPYYDNVMYGECSDYFYVWLKRSLRDTWPQFCDLSLTDKDAEAVANPSLFTDVAASSGRGKNKQPGQKSAAELADARYEELLRSSFKEAYRVLKDDGVMTVMFTHKRVDAWDTLGVALLDAGFTVASSWPVHTESENSLHQAKKNAASSTIFLSCRKRESSEPTYWADIRSEIERTAEDAVREFSAAGMTGIDLTIATYGPVLSVLSRRWPVYTGELDVNGQSEVLRPDAALDLARERVATLKKRGLLGGRDVEFDRVTDWYLLAWSDFAAAAFPYDEARKLSLATHLDLNDLAKRNGIIKQASGTVTLRTPAERRTAGALDPDASSWLTMLDRLHALMLTYDEEGLAAGKAWLARTGMGDDPRFTDLVAAALHAIPRVRDKGVFARPEARILDSLRAAFFEQISTPVDEEPEQKPAQGELDFTG